MVGTANRVKHPNVVRRTLARRAFRRKLISYTTSGLARVVALIYIIVAHMMLLAFWPRGLVIDYVNDKPWPYKNLFITFFDSWEVLDDDY